MIHALTKNWWLLALCGALDAIIAVIYFKHAGQGFHAPPDVPFLGKLTAAAGACTIVAGILGSRKGKSWLLILNGVACSALGLIFNFLDRSPPLSYCRALHHRDGSEPRHS